MKIGGLDDFLTVLRDSGWCGHDQVGFFLYLDLVLAVNLRRLQFGCRWGSPLDSAVLSRLNLFVFSLSSCNKATTHVCNDVSQGQEGGGDSIVFEYLSETDSSLPV